MKILDQISSTFWLGLSLFVCVQSAEAGIGTLQVPGPGFLPFFASSFLGILAIIQIAITFFTQQKEGKAILWKGTRWGGVIIVFICLFLYTILVTKIGYIIATFGLMFVLFRIGEKQKVLITVIISFLTSLVTYSFFYLWLNVQLPKGLVPF